MIPQTVSNTDDRLEACPTRENTPTGEVVTPASRPSTVMVGATSLGVKVMVLDDEKDCAGPTGTLKISVIVAEIV